MTADDGFLGHLEQHLGTIRHIASGHSDLVEFHQPDPGISTVITNGLRFQSLTATRPQELVCSLWEGQRDIARYFVDSMAGVLLEQGRGLEYGAVVVNDRPVLEGTEMHGVLAHPSPYFGSDFDLFPGASGEPGVQIITLMPVTAPEAALVEEEDADELFERFWAKRPNLLDVTRPSAV
ncbi:suppressor of fused domain protein [Streptomyces sp. NPDC059850]|uniref:suppressor of fused domain protein n=1 Tax=Streptomyces sp. NPDC059850 TaxID=3346970 RepID=UPI003656B8BA